jgi:hypothetical protein
VGWQRRVRWCASPEVAAALDPGSSVSFSTVATPSTPLSKISVSPHYFSLSKNALTLSFIYGNAISPLKFVPLFAEDESETKHLEALEGAETRLRLFQIDLLDYGSIVSAVNGCVGVFHVASPNVLQQVPDPQVFFICLIFTQELEIIYIYVMI